MIEFICMVNTNLINMNYTRIYNEIIQNAKSEDRISVADSCYESHHINPKCMGGGNEDENLVLLTYREHFLCHWLLTKIHDDFKLVYAWNSFCMDNRGMRNTSHLYEYARRKFVEMLKHNNVWKKKMAKSMSMLVWMKKETESIRIHKDLVKEFECAGFIRGRIIKHRTPHSEETIKKISKSHSGKTSPMRGKTTRLKGRSYDELFGEEKSKELKKQRSETRKEWWKKQQNNL